MSVYLKLTQFMSQQTYVTIKSIVHILTTMFVECSTHIDIVGPSISKYAIGHQVQGVCQHILIGVALWECIQLYDVFRLSNCRSVALCFVHGVHHCSKFQPGVKLLFECHSQGVLDGQATCGVIGGYWIAEGVWQYALAG